MLRIELVEAMVEGGRSGKNNDSGNLMQDTDALTQVVGVEADILTCIVNRIFSLIRCQG